MSYDNYKTARDMAWKILLECGINSLPVRPSAVCEHYGWVLADYKTGGASIALLGLEGMTKQTDGFCAVTKNHAYIFFDSTLPAGRQRFTIAHEVGHLVLGHVTPGGVTTVNREPTPGDNPIERQANQFVARLLAPACVLLAAGITTRDAIERVCRVNRRASDFILARLAERPGYTPQNPDEIEVVRRFVRSLQV